MNTGCFPKFQSAYRQGHSTETALLRVHNDIVRQVGQGDTVALVLLDLSAAFDTIDKTILTERLSTDFGIRGNALAWFQSYLNNRTMSVKINDSESSHRSVDFGVPQGSILGPILYQLYTAPLESIIKKYGLSFHIYADDTQIYISLSNEPNSINTLEKCLEDIRNWMVVNKLKLNESKTEILKISPRRSRLDLEGKHLNIAGKEVSLPTADCIRNLGCFFDSHLTMKKILLKSVRLAIFI